MRLRHVLVAVLEAFKSKYVTQQSQFGFERATLEELQARLRIEERLRDRSVNDTMHDHHQGWVNYLAELIDQKRQ